MAKTNKMFRAEDETWELFDDACEKNGVTRGTELRRFMKEYIDENLEPKEKKFDIKNFGDLQKLISRIRIISDPNKNDKVSHEARCLGKSGFL